MSEHSQSPVPTPSASLPSGASGGPQAPERSGVAAIEIMGLHKSFGSKVAVNQVSLSIPSGTFYGLVGPNGAGKTTLLSMACGLLQPNAGTAQVLGHDMWASPDQARQAKAQLGILPDGLHMFDRLTGREHLTYVGLLRDMDRAVVAQRTEELLQALGLQDDGNKLVADYSAGMRKKIGLACALIAGPRVVVLDEPFEAVDPISAANLQDILKSFVAGGGTVVLSSHVMATVEKLCTHVAVMNQGRVLAAGGMAQVTGGGTLEARFEELVGGRKQAEGLEWLRHS